MHVVLFFLLFLNDCTAFVAAQVCFFSVLGGTYQAVLRLN